MNNEDIKVLEEYLDKQDRKFVSKYRLAFLQALENILKERQEDKERIKELEKYEKYYQNERNLLDSYISKSKVRAKIKEINNSNENYTFYKLTSADIRRTITTNLEELLQEGDN